VRAAGAISYLPLGGGENMGDFAVEGEPPVNPGHEPKAERRWVTPGYFAAMGIVIHRGRVFTPRDTADRPPVVVVNETIAQQFFGSGDPLGRRLRVGGARIIVGVVADVKSSSLETNGRPQLYFPHAQWPWAEMTVVVNSNQDPRELVSSARKELKALDALIPPANIRTLQCNRSSRAARSRRFNTASLTFFAVSALFLTVMGIYGVVSFLVSRRSKENRDSDGTGRPTGRYPSVGS
jgi:putative ABC transport system permease protein